MIRVPVQQHQHVQANWVGSPFYKAQSSIGYANGILPSTSTRPGAFQANAKQWSHKYTHGRQSINLRPYSSNSSSVPAQSSISGIAANAANAVVRRPSWLLLVPTFFATHFTLAWALVPPIYFTLRQTQLSNTLLAGPQGAWLLSRKVPSWMPDVVIDGMVGSGPQSGDPDHAKEQLTIEQLMERMARRGIRVGWKYAKLGGSAVKVLRGGAKGPKKEDEDELTGEAMRSLGVKDKNTSSGIDSSSSSSNSTVPGSDHFRSLKDTFVGYTKKSARSAADEIEFGHVRDGIAAWVLVKILFPVRLPVSLWLTPKVARTLVKILSRK